MTQMTTDLNMNTQRDQILRWLRTGPQCGTLFLKLFIPRYSARIYELRKAGYQITKKQCKRHPHGSRQYLYELVT